MERFPLWYNFVLSYSEMRRTTCNGCHTGFPGQVVQSQIKLAQHTCKCPNFNYSFQWGPSVLGLHNLKLKPTHKQWKTSWSKKKIIHLLIFYIGLTSLHTKQPRLSTTGSRPDQGHRLESSFIQKISPWNYQKVFKGDHAGLFMAVLKAHWKTWTIYRLQESSLNLCKMCTFPL